MLLSVIILFTDDDIHFLKRAVDSVKKGVKFLDYEIILVNNCEYDKSEIKIDNVKIISKGYNLYTFEGRRFGFENSKGDFIWNFDVDDLMIGELFKDDIKKDVDFIQMYYLYNPESRFNPLLTKRPPQVYGGNAWSRIYNRNILQKVYNCINKPVKIFTFDDQILFDFVNSYKPKYEYIERPIYQYNVSNATNRPENIKKNEKLLKIGLEDYEYIYNILGKKYMAKELKNSIKKLLQGAK